MNRLNRLFFNFGLKYNQRFIEKIKKKEKIPWYYWWIVTPFEKIYRPYGYLEDPKSIIKDIVGWLKDNTNTAIAGGTLLLWLVFSLLLLFAVENKININETVIFWSWWPVLIISLAITFRYYWRRVWKEVEIHRRVYKKWNIEMGFLEEGIEPDFRFGKDELENWKKIDTPFWTAVRISMKISWVVALSLVIVQILIWLGIFV